MVSTLVMWVDFFDVHNGLVRVWQKIRLDSKVGKKGRRVLVSIVYLG